MKPCNVRTQVLMEQLWGYIYTLAKHPIVDLLQHPNQLDERHIRRPLRELVKHGVRWWDPAIWPQDFVDGKWEQQYPIAFLVANLRNLRTGSVNVFMAICKGTL